MTARVLGFIVQCEVCPQQALLDGYMEGWLCPRCAEVASDVPVAEAPLWRVKDDPGFRYEMHVGGKVAGAPLAAVVFPDGRKFVGEYRMDVKADADPMKRALAAIGAAWAAADALLNPDAGFGDVDVAQAEPTPFPVTVPLRDPLAVAIQAESIRNPRDPRVTAVVGGELFHLRSWTERRNSPWLELSWMKAEPSRLVVAQCIYGCGRPVIASGESCGVSGCYPPEVEPELPYKPPPNVTLTDAVDAVVYCSDQSAGGRVCGEPSPHIGRSHRAVDGWRWWRDGGPAFGPGGTEDTSLSEVRG